MNRFSLSSNIYNQYEIIKNASQIGISLFRRFNNIFIFKNLVAGDNVRINETENFITIHSGPQTRNHMVFSLTGVTDGNSIVRLRSDRDVYMNCIGTIGERPLCFNTKNHLFVGVHTHDDDLNVSLSEKVDISYAESGKAFEMFINAFSSTDILVESDHTINFLR